MLMLCLCLCLCLCASENRPLATKDTGADNLPYGLGVAAYWCGFFNSSVNPIIFVIRNDRFREGYRDILSKVWYGLRCKRPPKLTKPHFKKTWYLNKRTGAEGENPHVVLRAIPSLTHVPDIELMSDMIITAVMTYETNLTRYFFLFQLVALGPFSRKSAKPELSLSCA